MYWLRKKIQTIDTDSEEKRDLIAKLKEMSKQLISLPYSEPFDTGYKRLNYVRYADDFIIGIIGSKADTQQVKNDIEAFFDGKTKNRTVKG